MVNQKNEICHLLTLKLFLTCLNVFLLLNTIVLVVVYPTMVVNGVVVMNLFSRHNLL